jgi:hypothetical protein
VLYQAYYFFNPKTKWWGSYIPDFSYSFFILLSLLLATVALWPKLKNNRLRDIPQFWFMTFSLLLYSIASFYAVFPSIHAIALDALMTVTVLVFVMYKLVRTEKHLDIILNGYVIYAGYMAYYVSQFGRLSNGRFSGAGMVESPDANGIAAAMAPAVVICLYYLWGCKGIIRKAIYSLIGIYLVNAFVQLGSRGAFLGIALSCSAFLFFLYFSKLRKKNQRLVVLGLVFLGFIGLAVVTDSAFWERMGTIKSQDLSVAAEQESGSTRVYFWLAAWEMAKDHPFGAGASGFIYFSDAYIPQGIDTGASRNRAVHSTWFEVLAEIGYLGMISFILTILSSFIVTIKTVLLLNKKQLIMQYYKAIAIGCALLCFAISMTFLNRFRAEILYWCILFSAISYNIFYIKINEIVGIEKDL